MKHKAFNLTAYPAQRLEHGWRTSVSLMMRPLTIAVEVLTVDELVSAIDNWTKELGKPDGNMPNGDEYNGWRVSVEPVDRWPAGFKSRFEQGVMVTA